MMKMNYGLGLVFTANYNKISARIFDFCLSNTIPSINHNAVIYNTKKLQKFNSDVKFQPVW